MLTRIERSIFLLLACLSIAGASYGQTLYISTAENEIFQIKDDNTISLVTSVSGLGKSIFDIAISPSNQFYGIVADEIIEIDIQNGSFTRLNTLPRWINDNTYTSLVCSDKNELYAINNNSLELYKYSIEDDTTELVAKINATTPGDLTIYRGSLVFPEFPYLKAFNLTDKTLTNIFCIPVVNGLIWGMGVQSDRCDGGKVFGTSAVGEIWEFNINSGNTTILPINTMGVTIYGMASDNEYLSTDCQFQFEPRLCGDDTLNTSATILPLPAIQIDLYPNPVLENLHIDSQQSIQQLSIYDISGKVITTSRNIDKQVFVGDLADGIYLVALWTEKGYYTKKIVKRSR